MAPTTLSINCAPTHGTVPWTATVTGNLLNAGVGVVGAPVYLQYYDVDAATWYNMYDTPATTVTDGAYGFTVIFESANGWAAGMTGTLRAAFLGDAVNDASVSGSVTVTMDGGGGGGATTLTFSCTPQSGTIPWDGAIAGRLTNTSGGVAASVSIQYLGADGVTWYPTGVSATTDSLGNYATTFPFTVANGWTPGSTGTLRAFFAGDAVNNASVSSNVTVTMNAGGTEGYMAVSATQNGVAVTASVTADGQSGTTPVTFTFTPAVPTTYTVAATYLGVTLTQTVTVSAGQTSTVAFNFGGGGGVNMLIPAALAFGVVSIALVATRKSGRHVVASKRRKRKRKRRR